MRAGRSLVRETHILRAAVASLAGTKLAKPRRMPVHLVSDLMTTRLVTVTENDDLAHAARLMTQEHVRHLPVVRASRLVGLLSQRDILRMAPSAVANLDHAQTEAWLRSISVSQAMVRDVVTVRPDATGRSAALTLLRRKFGCLPVVDAEGRLLGIVTETDFVRHAAVTLEEEEAAGEEQPHTYWDGAR
jgi:CBS domain-containing protein